MRNKIHCPNKECDFYGEVNSKMYWKDGFFKRENSINKVQRYKCKRCKQRFSSSTFNINYRFKKNDLEKKVLRLFVNGVSISGIADILEINWRTVSKRISILSKKGVSLHHDWLSKNKKTIKEVQFDEMETYEHSKLKPVSISLAVVSRSKQIIFAEAGEIRAKGHTARDSVRKYGFRENDRKCRSAFRVLKEVCVDECTLITDQLKSYIGLKKVFLPNARHKQTLSRGNSSKKLEQPNKSFKNERKEWSGYDPLFALNNMCAQLRYRISCFRRASWCRALSVDRIQEALNIFVAYNNKYRGFR